MFSCSHARSRLAALGDPTRVPADVAGHVGGCSACAGYARALSRVDQLVSMLPVPAADPLALARALELASAGPIIAARPAPVVTPSALNRLSRWALETHESWQYVAGVAAVLAVGVSLYWAGTRGPRTEVAGPRHELLKSQVQSLALLSKADTAEARLAVWSDVARELVAEAERVNVGASPEDLESLDRMFSRAVSQGLVEAKRLPPNLTAPERRAKLKPALERAAAMEVAARDLSERAPVQAVPAMKNLARTAAECRKALAAVARPEA